MPTMRLVLMLFTVLAFSGLIAGCADDMEGPPDLSEERANLAAVVTEPQAPEGEEVTVAGEVVRSREGAFVLEAEGERLLIVPQTPPERAYEPGTVVRAHGTVEPIPGDDDRDLVGEEPLFDEFEGEPTLAATELTVVE